MSVVSRIAAPPELDRSLRDQLFGLFSSCFDNTTRERFERDLGAKHWVVLVMDGSEVAGFTTAELVSLDHRGEELRFLYSGDTLVNPQHWGRPALAPAFGHLMLDLLDRAQAPLYWFLVSKGFRTYRLMPANFRGFVPDCRRPPDHELVQRLRLVARAKFGDRFDAAAGVIRAECDTEYLKPELQTVAPGRRQNPHIVFFLEKNPGWRRGDQLACLAPCVRANLTRLAWRQLESVSPVREWQ